MHPEIRVWLKNRNRRWNFLLKRKQMKHWNWKFFSVFFGKLKSVENTEIIMLYLDLIPFHVFESSYIVNMNDDDDDYKQKIS